MSLRVPGFFAGVLLAFVLLTPVLAAPTFPRLEGRVVDNAELLSPSAEARLTAELAELERRTGRQLVVATLPDLQGYEIEEYGYQLLRTWGIGRKDEDDGVILIVAPNERAVRIEVGYGLEPILTDALSRLIIERQILPAFREGEFERGIVAGTGAIVRQLGLPEAEARAAVQVAEAEGRQAAGDGGSIIPVIFAVFVVFWLLSGVLRLFGVRRRFGGSGLWWLLPLILSSSSHRRGGWSGGGGWSSGGGGFSGGGGSGGGGGASGRW